MREEQVAEIFPDDLILLMVLGRWWRGLGWVGLGVVSRETETETRGVCVCAPTPKIDNGTNHKHTILTQTPYLVVVEPNVAPVLGPEEAAPAGVAVHGEGEGGEARALLRVEPRLVHPPRRPLGRVGGGGGGGECDGGGRRPCALREAARGLVGPCLLGRHREGGEEKGMGRRREQGGGGGGEG